MNLISALLAAAFLMCAQTPTGEIHLEVKDPSGSPMRSSGKLQNPAAGIDRAFQTDSHGISTLSNLPYGRYQIEIARAGFAAQSFSLDVQSATPVLRAVTLSLASQASQIEVVAATPLAGTDLDILQIPAPVQTTGVHDLEQTGALDLSDLLNRRLDGVHINENQENPFQPDVSYRGYTASPLLGTPEGISVYMDGVRQNRPFGDIVAWDLIPKIAIAEVALMPGSNPLFGLNTLGGALSIQTKDGNSQPGATLQASGGSFARRTGEFEYGGSNAAGFNWYAAGNLFREDGWRQFSPSEVRQAFTKIGWQRGATSISLSFTYADNWLTGNGLQDTRFLAQSYNGVYSVPDITWNHSPSLNLRASHQAGTTLTLSGNAYFRYIRGNTVNGDINLDSTDSTGIVTSTATKEHNYGISGQAAWTLPHNRVIAGAAVDRSTAVFQQGSQLGDLAADGVTVVPDPSPAANLGDNAIDLRGIIATYSVYATDTINLGKSLALTISGRYNRTSIDNTDRLPFDPTGARGSLNGRYVFPRFNPAAGFTYAPWRFASFYFSYSQASRAPTSIELGCADPTKPCNFPNALVSDPPLKQVVTGTFEAGARGSLETLRWSAGWFRATNDNDLLFVSSQQTGFGYFTNFGQTRRQGAEFSLSRRFHQFTLGGNYTFLNATYQSVQTVDGHANSANDAGPGQDGNITVQPGDRIPQIPRNILKAYAEYQASKLSVDLDFIAVGRSYARGNENNLDQPDGLYYLGPGFSPGYGVVDVAAHYQLRKRVQVFVEVNNLLNHHYFTAAQLGTTPFDNAHNFLPQPWPSTTFFAPGAPLGAWGGIRFKF